MNQSKSNTNKDTGLIFNIQKFSVHDGAGIRTLIFMKGCPLLCDWCSNPEGQSHSQELAYNADKCIGVSECDFCRRVCEQDAICVRDDGKVEIERMACTNCRECVDACPSKALELFGNYMSVDEVIAIVEEDSGFYARSGGGLTLSGGEPILQTAFVVKLLMKARSRGIDTAIETSGLCNWPDLEEVGHHVNQIFFDIKSMDPEKHKRATGVDNEPVLENFRRLCKTFPELPVIVRTPVIPGFNDTPEDIRAISDFINGIKPSAEYELLAYHRFGEPKYKQLGKKYPLPDLAPPTEERMEELRAVTRTTEATRS